MRFGVTASKFSVTEAQILAGLRIMREQGCEEFHYGDCVGGDWQMHHLVARFLYPETKIIQHPPEDQSRRGFAIPNTEARAPKPYLDRNRDIVDESDALLVLPKTATKRTRGSGTWYTYRYAKRQRKKVYLILPDGTVNEE